MTSNRIENLETYPNNQNRYETPIKLQFPKMVFSIIGDSDNFVPKPWRKTVFQSALIDAAQNAGESWITVRGDTGGVTEIVIDAFQDYFCKEYFDVKGKYTGEKTKCENNLPIHLPISLMRLRTDGNVIRPRLLGFASRSEQEKKLYYEFKLEEWPVTIPRTENELSADEAVFEEKMSKQEGYFFNLDDLGMRVPVILIVVEGDLQTIEYAEAAIGKNIPVLLVKGSGKAADLVVACIQGDAEIDVAVNEMSPLLFGISFDETNLVRLRKTIDTLVSTKHLISVFDVDNDDPLILSKIIGEAIVRTWAMENAHKGNGSERNTPAKQFSYNKGKASEPPQVIFPDSTKTPFDVHLYNVQNMYDQGSSSSEPSVPGPVEYDYPNKDTRHPVVYIGVRKSLTQDPKDQEYVKALNSRPHVLNTKFLSPASLPLYFYFGYQLLQGQKRYKSCDEQFSILLLEALKSNRRDYVQVLLDQGVEFNIDHLQNLYNTTVKCPSCDKKDECLHISWILRQFVDLELDDDRGHMKPNKDIAKKIRKNATHLVRKLLGYKEPKGSTEYEKTMSKEDRKDAERKTISDILLWSIFANRPDLSQVLWLATDNHLMTGLVCTALLKKIAKKASNVKEEVLSRSLNEHAKLFSDRCLEMLTEMYDQNAKAAMKIVDSEVKIWGILSTPMTFAYENYEMDFIAHTCPQRRLNRIWYNKLAPDFKIFLKASVREPKKFLQAPFTRFLINYILFLLMLIAFSALVMTSIDDHYYRRSIARVWEYYIYIWAGGDLIEEIKNGMGIFTTGGKSHRGYWSRGKRYINDFWNAVDLLSYILLILALLTRHLWEPDPFTIARRTFSVSLLIMFLRYLQLFLMNRRLGPTLIMIKEMLKDLSYFLAIAFVAIVGVGIYYHANLYPNHINLVGEGTWDTWHVWKILYYPYWQLYGESFSEFLEVQEQSNCTSDRSVYEVSTDIERCAEKDPTVPIVSAIYMLISNLLLVNLVIAMFSYTFDTVMANSEKLWRFERYTVITDYEGKVPSPFNFIIRPIQLLNFARKKCMKILHKEKEHKEKLRSKWLFKLRFQKMIASRISSSQDSTSST